METVDELLKEAVAMHGHLCSGQVLGVRMAVLGCRAIGIDRPRETKRLIMFVEIDRCATDAISSVTGCRLGKRTLKYVDYGKMAATFLNTDTGEAVRVMARDDSRERAWRYAPEGMSKEQAQLQAYTVMPEDELFMVAPVRMQLSEEDLPGHPVSRVSCERCGESVNDRREVKLEGRAVCRACAYGAYYDAGDSKTCHLRPGGTVSTLQGVFHSGTTPSDRLAARPGLKVAALVLAGGRGRRMGTAKPFALWRGVPLIEHVVRRAGDIFDTVYVVARDPDEFSFLEVPVVEDVERDRGPLMGIYSGMARCSEDWFFVIGCDMPLLSAPLIRHMQGFISPGDIVAARIRGRLHPLHAFYSRRCLSTVDDLLRRSMTSLQDILNVCTTTVIPEQELARLDPELVSFADVDTPDQLARLGQEVSS